MTLIELPQALKELGAIQSAKGVELTDIPSGNQMGHLPNRVLDKVASNAHKYHSQSRPSDSYRQKPHLGPTHHVASRVLTVRHEMLVV